MNKTTINEAEQPDVVAPKTSVDIAAQVAELEAELAAIPAKIEVMRKASAGEIASQKLEDCIAIIEQLRLKEKTLRVRIWHFSQEKLRLEIEEAKTLQATLPEEIAKAAAEVDECRDAVEVAKVKLAAADLRLSAVRNRRSGAVRTISDKGAELLSLQRQQPTI